MKNLYVIFYTTSEAIATEIICKNNNIKGKLVSIPRHISAGCGMSFESDAENYEKIKMLLDEEKIEYEKIVL